MTERDICMQTRAQAKREEFINSSRIGASAVQGLATIVVSDQQECATEQHLPQQCAMPQQAMQQHAAEAVESGNGAEDVLSHTSQGKDTDATATSAAPLVNMHAPAELAQRDSHTGRCLAGRRQIVGRRLDWSTGIWSTRMKKCLQELQLYLQSGG
jgi:hypothetical protein